jgi:hypothetical protein
MSDRNSHPRLSRNVWEKLNGYPSRSGTARRDGQGRLLPGEYNGRGERLGSNSAPDLTLTKPHDWSGFEQAFGPRKDTGREAGDDGSADPAQADAEREAMDRELAGRSRGRQRGRAPGDDDLAALNRDFARRFDEARHPVGAQPQDDAADGSGDVPPGRPRAMPETRTTSYGSIETKDPATGRWLGSVRNAPPANWSRTGGEGSPTGPRLVRMKPIPKPLPYYDASGKWNAKNAAANMEQDRRMYAPGGMIESESEPNPERVASDKAWKAIVAHGGKNGGGMTPYGRVEVKGFKEPPVERYGPPAPEWYGPPAPMSDRAKELVKQVTMPLPKKVEPKPSSPMTLEKTGQLYSDFKRDSKPSPAVPARPVPFTPTGEDPSQELQNFIASETPAAAAPPAELADTGNARKKKNTLPQ